MAATRASRRQRQLTPEEQLGAAEARIALLERELAERDKQLALSQQLHAMSLETVARVEQAAALRVDELMPLVEDLTQQVTRANQREQQLQQKLEETSAEVDERGKQLAFKVLYQPRADFTV
jgi:hypothetical protein